MKSNSCVCKNCQCDPCECSRENPCSTNIDCSSTWCNWKNSTIALFVLFALVMGVFLFVQTNVYPEAREIFNLGKSSGEVTTSGRGKILVTTTMPADFGTIPIGGGKVSTKFSFKNTGNSTLTILNGQTSCMCTVANIQKIGEPLSPTITMPMGQGSSSTGLNIALAPDETADLIAIFDPMAHGPNAIGPIKRDVILTTDSKETPEIRFSFLGNVVR